ALEQEIELIVHMQAVGADMVRHDKSRRRNALAFENGKGIVVDVGIAIVKGHGRDRPGWRLPSFQNTSQVIQRDKVVAAANPIEVTFEGLYADEHGRNGTRGAGLEVLD